MTKRVKYFTFQKGVEVANELANVWVRLSDDTQDAIRALFTRERLPGAGFAPLHDCIAHLPSNDLRLLTIRRCISQCIKAGNMMSVAESRVRALRLYNENESHLTPEQRLILACLTITHVEHLSVAAVMQAPPAKIIQTALTSCNEGCCDQHTVRIFTEALRETIKKRKKVF